MSRPSHPSDCTGGAQAGSGFGGSLFWGVGCFIRRGHFYGTQPCSGPRTLAAGCQETKTLPGGARGPGCSPDISPSTTPPPINLCLVPEAPRRGGWAERAAGGWAAAMAVQPRSEPGTSSRAAAAARGSHRGRQRTGSVPGTDAPPGCAWPPPRKVLEATQPAWARLFACVAPRRLPWPQKAVHTVTQQPAALTAP